MPVKPAFSMALLTRLRPSSLLLMLGLLGAAGSAAWQCTRSIALALIAG